VGAALAVWGDKRVGTIDPISLRAGFIILGVIMMLFGFILARTLRDTARVPNSIQPTGASRLVEFQPSFQWRLAPMADARRWV
jgi:hypothetical protein